MGVPKIIPLVSYEYNPSLWETIPFKDVQLVIDGNCLMHYLYTKLGIDVIGNYNEYSLKVENFFQWLKECNITPFVVFDGAYEPDDRKLETVMMRAINRINDPKKNSPILTQMTFLNSLNRLGIKVATCDYEADREIHVLANQLNCPVLSFDSDFFVLEIKRGYIPMDQFLGHLDLITSGGNANHAIHVHVYYVEKLRGKFPYLNGNMALLATVLGNDYLSSSSSILSSLYASEDFHMPKHIKEPIFEKECPHLCIIVRRALNWIRKCKTVEAGKRRLLRFGDEKQIQLSLDAFSERIDHSRCTVYVYFKDGSIQSKYPRFIPDKLTTGNRQCQFSNFIMNTVINKRNILLHQFEGNNNVSSHACSKSLRLVIYCLLLDIDTTVKEYDRKGHKLCEIEFQLLNISREVSHTTKIELHLNELFSTEMSTEDSFHVISRSLCCLVPDKEICQLFHIRPLYVMILSFWVKMASPAIDISYIKSALLCSMYLAVKKGMVYSTIPNQQIQYIINNVNTKATEYASRFLSNYSSPILYVFAQLQSCFYFATNLNKLLDCPFENEDPANVFNGTFLHNVYFAMKENENFLLEHLGSANPVFSILEEMVNLVQKTML